MTPAQRQLARRAEAILRREIGLRDDELAAKLGVPIAEVLPVVRAMWAMRRCDRCWGWTVSEPARRAA